MTVAIDVPCPDCDNLNRAARRACMHGKGMCNGKGTVTKYVAENEVEDFAHCRACGQENDCACGICWECHSKGVPGA
jgi:hypothetical protein